MAKSGTSGNLRLSRREFLAASAAVAAAACAPGAAPTGQGSTAPAPPSVPTGTFTLALSQEILKTDPAKAGLNDRNNLGTNLYNALVLRGPQGKLLPDLATSWENVAPTEWIFRLRKDVKFHNGEPFNAASVVGTIARYHDGGPQRFSTVVNALVRGEVVDDYTVKIVTTKVEPLILERLYKMPIIPPKYMKDVGETAFEEKPVGTGPFKWVEWKKGDRVILEANLDYFQGPPKVKTLHIRSIPENATRIAALKAGEVDLIVQMPPDQVDLITSDSNLRVATGNSPRVIFIEFYPDSPVGDGKPFRDVRVRQALNYAVNADVYAKTILNGFAIPRATIVAPEAFGYDDSVKPYGYDIEKAKGLLAQAGYGPASPLKFDLWVWTSGLQLKPVEIAQAVAADWQKAGVNVTVRPVDANTYQQAKADYKIGPVFFWNWVGFDADEPIWGNGSQDSAFAYWPGRVPPKVGKDAIDKLIDEERSIVDPARRTAIFKELQQILKDQAPYVTLYQQQDIYAVSKKVQNWDPLPEAPIRLWDVYKTP
jgi:peptide/nickel transport system substrate-binding protein